MDRLRNHKQTSSGDLTFKLGARLASLREVLFCGTKAGICLPAGRQGFWDLEFQIRG
jgi:hypothetical protein